MKKENLMWSSLALVLVGAFSAFLWGSAPKNASLSTGEVNRWVVIAHFADASKTLLLDSATGESFMLTAMGDTHSWKKIEKK